MPAKSAGNIKDKAVKAALKLAAEKGWEHVSLRDIGDEAGIPLAELHDYFEDRLDILTALGRMIDRKTLENSGQGEAGISHRDRLFDILMERFDVLNEHRDGITAILRTFKCDPKQAIISLPHLCRSMSWMLDAAGIETSGIKGVARIAGLTGLYLKTLWVWMDDVSEDMAKTMAALDKNLERAERMANSFGF